MADGLTFSGLRDAYAAASPARKLVWGVLILLLLALPAAFLWQASQPPREYRVLFAGLSDRDGGEVVEALERLHIPYRLAEPDGAIEVPAEKLHIARYKLAAQGLPRGDGPRDEATGPRFGLSTFQEQLAHQRALEAELARTVESLDAVESARVHLALPKPSAFLRERPPPAASVLLRPKPGAILDEEQIEAMRQIVAGGVPGMQAERVSIVDQGGSLLAAGIMDAYRGLSPGQLEYARSLEADLAGRVRRMLTPVLGGVAFRVQVTARIGGSESGNPPGRLQRLSALVVVDERGGLDAAALERLAGLARQAIGFEAGRGDSLQVIAVPFNPAAAPAPAAKPSRSVPQAATPARAFVGQELLPVHAGLALALLLFVAYLVLRARQRRREAKAAGEAPLPAGDPFEGRLEGLRQRVLNDPRVTAGVVKLWLQTPDGGGPRMNRAGLEKAAVLLLALGEEAAAGVLRYLTPFEVGELGRVMRELGALPRERVVAVLDDYEAEAGRQTGIGADADQFLDAALTRALGSERARRLLARITAAGSSVGQLAYREPAEVAALLKDEPPQLAAAVLAQLDRTHAAATLEWLPEGQREEVVRRLAEWHGAPAEALRELDEWLAHRLGGEAEDESGARLAADLLARLSPAAREKVESGLAAHSPELLGQLKAQQLGLDDLARLTADARTRFFKAVPARTLLLALKGADPERVGQLLERMPKTAARRLKDDLDSVGAARVADIEAAQAETVRLLRQMAAAGELEWAQAEFES